MIQCCQHCRGLSGLEADSWGEHGERSCHSLGVNTEGILVKGVYKTVFGDQLNIGFLDIRDCVLHDGDDRLDVLIYLGAALVYDVSVSLIMNPT